MPAVTLTDDLLRGQVTVTLPTVASMTSATPDVWQIARTAGNNAAWIPSSSDIVAEIPAGALTWIDRQPFAGRGTYAARLRLARYPDKYTSWTTPTVLPAPASNHRPATATPFMVLELSSANGPSWPAEVETASTDRFPVKGTVAQYQLVVDYRANAASGTSSIGIGCRFYDKQGNFNGENLSATSLAAVNGENPNGRVTYTLTPPDGTASLGIVLALVGATAGLKVRIENVELYRREPNDHNTGWDYVQVADDNGEYPDRRPELVDISAFAYDGVGWSFVTASPPGAGQKGPYRETSTADDDISFLSQGQWVEVLFHGHTADATFAIERLVDSAIGHLNTDATGQKDASLWEPIFDTGISGVTPVWGPNLCLVPDASSTTGWTLDYLSNYPHPNGILKQGNSGGAALTTTNTTPVSAGNYFVATLPAIGDTVTYPFVGQTFWAGRVYHGQVKIRKSGAGSRNVSVALGSSDPGYVTSSTPNIALGSLTLYFNNDRVVITKSLTSGVTTIDVYWTPQFDTNYAYFAINVEDAASGNIEFDDVRVEELQGYKLAAGTDFALRTVKLPGLFDPRHATPYRIRHISGTIRPLGLRRDPIATVDIRNDFATVLRALGDLRNLAGGELESRSDFTPKTMLHHKRRGKDHTRIQNGIDLRFGRNVTARKRARDATNVTNRLILVGYGSDKTQLVLEVRASKDVQGRVPSDPNYRVDVNGVAFGANGWDKYTGGTSEDIYGPRYGVYRDTSITTTYQAQETGTNIVELSAFPAETYDLSLINLDTVPRELEPGDLVAFHLDGKDFLRRIVDITRDFSSPRALDITAGENYDEAASRIERITKDVDTVLSFMSES